MIITIILLLCTVKLPPKCVEVNIAMLILQFVIQIYV